MVSIESDDPAVGRSLERLLAAARRAGAEFTDDLILRCADNSLSLALPPDSTPQRLMKLPEAALIPVRPFRLSLAGDDIVIDSVEAGVSAARRTLMEGMLELYNLTRKISWFRRTSVRMLLRARPDLGSLVTRGCDPPMRRHILAPVAAGAERSFLVNQFLGTRVVDFRDGRTDPELFVLAPILDLMNHHAQGAAFQTGHDEVGRYLHVERPKSPPLPGTECFASYGSYDAMETLLRYNFVDESGSFVRSVPVEIRLPDVGAIAVEAGGEKGAGKNLPPALRSIGQFLPKILGRGPRYLRVAFLAVPATPAPHALRRVLNLLIAHLGREHLDRLDLILAAERQVIDATRAHYQELRGKLAAAPSSGPDESAILDDLTRACDLQLARLHGYADMVRNLAA